MNEKALNKLWGEVAKVKRGKIGRNYYTSVFIEDPREPPKEEEEEEKELYNS